MSSCVVLDFDESASLCSPAASADVRTCDSSVRVLDFSAVQSSSDDSLVLIIGFGDPATGVTSGFLSKPSCTSTPLKKGASRQIAFAEGKFTGAMRVASKYCG